MYKKNATKKKYLTNSINIFLKALSIAQNAEIAAA
jgi:hypothetical protein